MYIEAVLSNYRLIQVPHNEQLRTELSGKSLDELTTILKKFKSSLHNSTDIVNEKRAIRAIEIEAYLSGNPQPDTPMPDIRSLNIGIRYERQTERNRITARLSQRLEEGMIEEARRLLDSGLTPESLSYYGLEYKFLTAYIEGQLTYREMFDQLNIAIHQFAKRQMTWFRRMEKNGIIIHWLDGELPLSSKLEAILKLLTV
jgi:tRNA dimethylallyltransferase